MEKSTLFMALYLLTFGINSSEVKVREEDILSDSEINALQELRLLTKDSFYLDYHNDTKFLINWLRNKEVNVEKTKNALEKNFKYRRENGLDRILDEPEMLKLLETFPATIGEAKDKTGSPACQIVSSSWDIRKGVLSGKADLMNRYAFFLMESLSNATRKSGMSQWVMLVDMNNYSIRKHACIPCIPFILQFAKIYEQHFMNAKYVIIYNAPRIFDALKNLFLPLLNAETKKKLNLFDSNKAEWQTFILSKFSEDQLTPSFGGTKSASF